MSFLLNFRPRFHGANLATAADIYFQTTGKLPNYLDAARGLALTDIARRDPNRVILREGSGKGGKINEVTGVNSIVGGGSGNLIFFSDVDTILGGSNNKICKICPSALIIPH